MQSFQRALTSPSPSSLEIFSNKHPSPKAAMVFRSTSKRSRFALLICNFSFKIHSGEGLCLTYLQLMSTACKREACSSHFLGSQMFANPDYIWKPHHDLAFQHLTFLPFCQSLLFAPRYMRESPPCTSLKQMADWTLPALSESMPDCAALPITLLSPPVGLSCGQAALPRHQPDSASPQILAGRPQPRDSCIRLIP